MIDKLKKKVKGVKQKIMAETHLGKQYNNIFEIKGVPAFNQFYNYGIFMWKYLYKGFYKQWHVVPAPTIKDLSGKRRIESMGVAKAISSELAGLIWNEQCDVSISLGNKDETLNDFVNEVLKDNNFFTKMQEHIEQSMALGGGALKVWSTPEYDDDGMVIKGTEHIEIGYAMADQFIPIAWTNSKITEGVFVSREAKEGYYYTRLEWHKWNGKTYVVDNELYRAKIQHRTNQDGEQEPQDILGFRYPLNELYPYLDEHTEIKVEDSLFTYYRTAIANNLDDNSPLGVSIYANALSTLHALDICYDSFVREFILGKKRIIVPSSAIRTVPDPQTGQLCRYFDATDEVYEALATDDTDKLKIQDNTIELRIDEHISAINAFLNILCLQVGFSAGTFTFDKTNGLKTATEIISENSKTYKTIKAHQSQVKKSIEDLVKGIIDVACLYDIQYQGKSIKNLVNKDLEIKVVFDDSILQDRQTNISEGILLMNNNVMSRFTFLTQVLQMTDEDAKAEIQRIQEESQVNTIQVDDFSDGDE